MKATVTRTLEIELTVEDVAAWFAGVDDETQAQFFIEVAKHAASWKAHGGYQWYSVGRHLRTCECSTEAARELIRTIHSGVET